MTVIGGFNPAFSYKDESNANINADPELSRLKAKLSHQREFERISAQFRERKDTIKNSTELGTAIEKEWELGHTQENIAKGIERICRNGDRGLLAIVLKNITESREFKRILAQESQEIRKAYNHRDFGNIDPNQLKSTLVKAVVVAKILLI